MHDDITDEKGKTKWSSPPEMRGITLQFFEEEISGSHVR